MTRIVYKKILGRYMIASISEADGEGLSIELSAPIDATVAIGKEVYKMKCGVCDVINALPDGEISPKLYTGSEMCPIESFINKNGEIHKASISDELVRSAFAGIDALEERLATAEALICDLEDKISRKINLI